MSETNAQRKPLSPRAYEPGRRRVYQQVTLTEAEREQLRGRAAELGVSVPRLMVEAALEGRETPTERRREVAELFEIRRLLATVANNINQLAKAANISGEVAAQERLAGSLGDVDEILGRLRGLTVASTRMGRIPGTDGSRGLATGP